jgi:alkylation response protein AidB-like acyl-CoA dehydrogenase
MQPDARQRGLQEDIAGVCEQLEAIGPAESEAFCAHKWGLVRESGLLGLPFAPDYGGRGEDLITTMHVLEALGRGCDDGGLAFSVTTQLVSAGIPLQRAGSEELKARYLPRIVAGSAIGAHAITEPSGGSDALAMSTRAVDHGDHYVLDGTKAFITHAPCADVFVVYARTRPEGGPLGITAFVVDRDTPGLRTSEPIGKLGLKGSPVGELVLDGCVVPAANVIGKPGSGFFVLDHVMKWEILLSFVTSAGAMGRRLARCIEHARGREQFGKPLGAFQAIAHKVVDMKIAVETSRRWLFDAAAKLLAGQDATTEIAIAKLVTSEANVKTALDAVQIFGASGYTTALGVEAGLRDAVGGTIYSGTSEIQRNRIAATLGLRDRR